MPVPRFGSSVAIGQIDGYLHSGSGQSGSATVATCSPEIRDRRISAPLHLFAGIDDGRSEVFYRYLDSFPPCLPLGAPPQVPEVVTAAGDGEIDVYWTPLQWEPPPNTRLVSYAINAIPVGAPGTVEGLPITTGVPHSSGSSSGMPITRVRSASLSPNPALFK